MVSGLFLTSMLMFSFFDFLQKTVRLFSSVGLIFKDWIKEEILINPSFFYIYLILNGKSILSCFYGNGTVKKIPMVTFVIMYLKYAERNSKYRKWNSKIYVNTFQEDKCGHNRWGKNELQHLRISQQKAI